MTVSVLFIVPCCILRAPAMDQDYLEYRAQLERHQHTYGHVGLRDTIRNVVLEWLLEVCDCYKLHLRTFLLAANMFERYASVAQVTMVNAQLLGSACLLSASKLEDKHAILSDNMCRTANNIFTCRQLHEAERQILQKLDHRLTIVFPTDCCDEPPETKALEERFTHLVLLACFDDRTRRLPTSSVVDMIHEILRGDRTNLMSAVELSATHRKHQPKRLESHNFFRRVPHD